MVPRHTFSLAVFALAVVIRGAAEFFTAFTLATLPAPDLVRDQVDLIEVNHFYTEDARHVFDQVLFYDWSSDDERFQLRAWRLVKSPAQFPRHDRRGGYVSTWLDGLDFRQVRAPSFRR